MQYSPKLKKVAKEINRILKKHDVPGVVILHDQHFSEYIFKLESNNNAVISHQGVVRIKTTERGWSKAEKKKRLQNTTNMLVHFQDNLTEKLMWVSQLKGGVEKHVEIINKGDSTHTPDHPLNN